MFADVNQESTIWNPLINQCLVAILSHFFNGRDMYLDFLFNLRGLLALCIFKVKITLSLYDCKNNKCSYTVSATCNLCSSEKCEEHDI